MDNLGETLRNLRLEKKLPLRIVAAYLEIDQAILSKMERGLRKYSREQVLKLASYYSIDENELLIPWLSENIISTFSNDDITIKALQMAEEQVAYNIFKKTDRNEVVQKITVEIQKFQYIQKAWLYGSFARGDDGPKSDIDIAIQTDEKFSYFDLADVQYVLEGILNRKIDVGFMDSFQPYIMEHVKPDLKLIYERPQA